MPPAVTVVGSAKHRILSLLAVFALLALTVLALPGRADAGIPRPPIPTGMHAVSWSKTSLTIAVARTPYARQYRLFVSTNRNYIHENEIIAHAQHGYASTGPVVTVTGIHYSLAPLYYRVQVYNPGRAPQYSAIGTAYLPPGTPTGLRAVSNSTGTSLTWNYAGKGFIVTEATNASLTQNRVNWVTKDTGTQFTPYSLAKGRTYYFRVRARNVTTSGSYSNEVSAVKATREQHVSVMSYNIRAIGAPVAPGDAAGASWPSRRRGAAALINEMQPDALGVQEGGAWLHGVKGPRQVDDLRSLLPGYALARTEVPPTEANYRRYGNYILYRTATYEAIGSGGTWGIGDGRYGEYQQLRSRSTGATFLFVTTHLIPTSGASYDSLRQAETARLIADANARAAGKMRVVYAGDFNSDLSSLHAFDGSSREMLATHHEDAIQTSRNFSNVQYDSGNQYLRTPPAFGLSIDHVYTDPGVAVRLFKVVLHLHDGTYIGTIPSDHDPIYSQLTIPF